MVLSCLGIPRVVGELAVEDAFALLPACRGSKHAIMKSYNLAAVAFAISRPKFLANGPQLGIKTWAELWDICAASVWQDGLDPKLWVKSAYARLICECRCMGACMCYDFGAGEAVICKSCLNDSDQCGCLAPRPSSMFCTKTELQFCEEDTFVVDLVSRVMPEASISGVLMASAQLCRVQNIYPAFEDLVFDALVVLSDKRFAWIAFEANQSSQEANASAMNRKLHANFTKHAATSYKGGLYIHSELHGVFEAVGASWIERNGRLSAVRRLQLPSMHHSSFSYPKFGDAEFDGAWRFLTVSAAFLQCCDPELPLPGVNEQVVVDDLISHPSSDPPAFRDEEVASVAVRVQADDDFALQVERRLAGGARELDLSNAVHIISFRSGQGELFRRMLLQDKEFSPLRKSLQAAGYPLILQPSEAIVLVRPDQYLDVIDSNTLHSHTLKRYMVIVAESEEYLMDEVLLRMASRQRPRENRQERVEVDLDDFAQHFVINRTFICQAPRMLQAGTVAQSTTEAYQPDASGYLAHSRGGNPRRRVLGEW